MRTSAFIGTMVGKPELRHSQSGTPILDITLRVKERKGETWEEHLFKMTAFGQMAERVSRQAKDGSEIVAFCKPENRKYTDKNGRERMSETHMVSWVRVCLTDGTEQKEIPA
jgi:single-stranded DNA-binding protein